MIDRVNLADPDAEPTDEQLIGLSRRAFAGVEAAHKQALEQLHLEIKVARARVLRHLAVEHARPMSLSLEAWPTVEHGAEPAGSDGGGEPEAAPEVIRGEK